MFSRRLSPGNKGDLPQYLASFRVFVPGRERELLIDLCDVISNQLHLNANSVQLGARDAAHLLRVSLVDLTPAQCGFVPAEARVAA